MGKYLDSAKAYIGRDAAGLLEGGRYALIHTRSLEFDELRPYVPGDDVRDIDWKATARSGHTLIKRFVSEKHHKVLVVADAGRNSCGLAPSGERKRTVARNLIGAIGLMTVPRSDEIAMVLGDRRGNVDIRLRRGESHIEQMLHRYHHHTADQPGPSDILVQLDRVARHYRHRLLIFVVSDEPEITDRLAEVLDALTARHDVLWALVSDMPAVGLPSAPGRSYEVADGRPILTGLDTEVVEAYRRAEAQRREQLSEFLTSRRIPHARVTGSVRIRAALTAMTGVYARAG
ncbi:DUF58 domain-containing protein [Mycobacterium sp. TNTM28]|uniref:DUF58 domain-containing protein n=1 Tax=[Mycobacterium] fortunisiensis TaxID=2600579 RepID=A0ABS6KUV6_9MYCO|nr:DUF58 domain-containing protein [[Mycobacterium] fortunisiensis]MBU9767326.1 DUF58 domain-containing protein [[Mycobacterium] fortunisiensis]